MTNDVQEEMVLEMTEPKKEEKESKDSSEQSNLSIGQKLKKERESQGLTLELIHDATNIPLDVLKAIEEGYNVRTLSPFYHKGFVKLYANHLRMDTSEVISSRPVTAVIKNNSQETNEFDVQAWLDQTFTRKRKQQIVIVCGAILGLIILFKIVALIGSSSRDNKSTAKVAKASSSVEKPRNEVRRSVVVPPVVTREKEEVKEVIPPKPVQSEPPRQVQAPSAASSTAVTSKKEVILTVRALQTGWLRVKSDGQVVYQRTLREGTVETWEASEKIEISGKNISQLEFELNGKLIGTLGRRDRQVKRLIVTKDGLDVSR